MDYSDALAVLVSLESSACEVAGALADIATEGACALALATEVSPDVLQLGDELHEAGRTATLVIVAIEREHTATADLVGALESLLHAVVDAEVALAGAPSSRASDVLASSIHVHPALLIAYRALFESTTRAVAQRPE